MPAQLWLEPGFDLASRHPHPSLPALVLEVELVFLKPVSPLWLLAWMKRIDLEERGVDQIQDNPILLAMAACLSSTAWPGLTTHCSSWA